MTDTLFELPTSLLGRDHYWPTAHWFAQELVRTYFRNLGRHSKVCEPTCGDGRFLSALPADVPAFGVELHADLAREARATTGREIIVGDIRSVTLPTGITEFIGNLPFDRALFDDILAVAHNSLANGGRCGFLLPAYFFQMARQTSEMIDRWEISVDLIPRNIFPNISIPLCFAMMEKGTGRRVRGLALYDEAAAVLTMQARVQHELADNRATWRAVVEDTLRAFGGTATLSQLYAAIEPKRPTANKWWREKIRQQVQIVADCIEPSTYRLPLAA
jgi:adenine-specific DNA-methyltransferase